MTPQDKLAPMGAFLAAAFLVVPVLELLLFIYVQNRIGLGLMLVGIVITAAAGAFLVRMQGLAVWTGLREDLQAGRMPGRRLAHGAMVLIGGALLLTPGFLTDAVGFLLMIPFVREALRRLGSRILQRRIIVIE